MQEPENQKTYANWDAQGREIFRIVPADNGVMIYPGCRDVEFVFENSAREPVTLKSGEGGQFIDGVTTDDVRARIPVKHIDADEQPDSA